MYTIAHIENAYTEKFGVPRQSGLVSDIMSRIVFEPEFRNPDALRGLGDFSHIWLIWEFSAAERRNSNIAKNFEDKNNNFSACDWRPTVRPPRLGGNVRLGVFATRSPFRPNPIGLSCVEIDHIEMKTADGPVIYVRGADLMNGTPIYDIKPYLPYADCRPQATGGFTDAAEKRTLHVELPEEVAETLGKETAEELTAVLRQDPRPAYQDDPDRVYTFSFAGHEISFRVEDGRAIDVRATTQTIYVGGET